MERLTGELGSCRRLLTPNTQMDAVPEEGVQQLHRCLNIAKAELKLSHNQRPQSLAVAVPLCSEIIHQCFLHNTCFFFLRGVKDITLPLVCM